MKVSRLTFVLPAVVFAACGTADPAFDIFSTGKADASADQSVAGDANRTSVEGALGGRTGVISTSSRTAGTRAKEQAPIDYDVLEGGGSDTGQSGEEGVATNRGGSGDDDEVVDSGSSASASEKSECAAKLGVAVEALKIVSASQVVNLNNPRGAYLIKMVGNMSALTLNVGQSNNESAFPGVCLVQRGNQAFAEVRVEGKLGAFYLNARGNQPTVEMDIIAGASIGKIEANLGGNRPRLSVHDQSGAECKQLSVQSKGAAPEAECSH